MKKILVISSSLRRNSNSDALAEAFAKGAAEAGNEVETITLKGKELHFCTGCLACQKTQRCVIADDAPGEIEGHAAMEAAYRRFAFQPICACSCSFRRWNSSIK